MSRSGPAGYRCSPQEPGERRRGVPGARRQVDAPGRPGRPTRSSAYSRAIPGTASRAFSCRTNTFHAATKGRGRRVTITVSSMSLTIPYRTSGPMTCTGAVAVKPSVVVRRTSCQPGCQVGLEDRVHVPAAVGDDAVRPVTDLDLELGTGDLRRREAAPAAQRGRRARAGLRGAARAGQLVVPHLGRGEQRASQHPDPARSPRTRRTARCARSTRGGAAGAATARSNPFSRRAARCVRGTDDAGLVEAADGPPGRAVRSTGPPPDEPTAGRALGDARHALSLRGRLPRGGLLGLRVAGGEHAAGRLQVGADEPVEQLELVQVPDQQVVGDVVDLLDVLGRLAVVLDDADVDDVERAEVGDRAVTADGVVLPGAVLRPARPACRRARRRASRCARRSRRP